MRKEEISEKIRPKICRVVSDYGEGTGIILNDVEGLVMTSFHLLGNFFVRTNKETSLQCWFFIKDESGKINYQKTADFLFTLYMFDFLDFNYRLTPNAIDKLEEENFDPNSAFDQQTLSSKVAMKILSNPRAYFNRLPLDGTSQIHNTGVIEILGEKVMADTQRGIQLLRGDEWKRHHTQINELKNNNRIEEELYNNITVIYNNEKITSCLFKSNASNTQRVLSSCFYHDIALLKMQEFDDGMLYGVGNKIIDSSNGCDINFLSKAEELAIGEKVYFAGFPLSQDQYTFSVGMVSSIIEDNKVDRVVIEAPVARGNSGGAVFVQRKKEHEQKYDLFIIGILSSEVAYVTRALLDIRRNLNTQSISQTVPHSNQMLSATRTNASTLDRYATFLNAHQSHSDEFIKFVINNISTGKAKVTRIFDYNEQLSQEIDVFDLIHSSIEFFIEKKIEKTKEFEGKKICECFKQYNGSLLVTQVINYVDQNSDELTAQIIKKNIGRSRDLGRCYFKIPQDCKLNTDESINLANVNVYQKNVLLEAPTLKTFLSLAIEVSKKTLVQGQVVHLNLKEFQVSSNYPYFSTGFVNNHIGGLNKAENEEKAQFSYKKRSAQNGNIVSTAINAQDTDKLHNEIKTNNENHIYATMIETIVKLVREKHVGCVLSAIYYWTKTKYSLSTVHANKIQSQNCQFFYCTHEHEGKHVLTHFEGTKVRPAWQKHSEECYFLLGNGS